MITGRYDYSIEVARRIIRQLLMMRKPSMCAECILKTITRKEALFLKYPLKSLII